MKATHARLKPSRPLNATNEHQEPSEFTPTFKWRHASGNCRPSILVIIQLCRFASTLRLTATRWPRNCIAIVTRNVWPAIYCSNDVCTEINAGIYDPPSHRAIFILINKILFIESTSNHCSSFLPLHPSPDPSCGRTKLVKVGRIITCRYSNVHKIIMHFSWTWCGYGNAERWTTSREKHIAPYTFDVRSMFRFSFFFFFFFIRISHCTLKRLIHYGALMC